MDSTQDESRGLRLIPCVYCTHSNPPGHRFCGMCGKALPDLVKQAARASAEGASGSPLPGSGIGVAGRTPAPSIPTANRPQAGSTIPAPTNPALTAPRPGSARPQEHPNRDLSYLLHDDHPPTKTNRTPFIVGGLILALVAGFFVMRGGGKATPAPNSTMSDSAEAPSPDAPPADKSKPPATTADAKPQAQALATETQNDEGKRAETHNAPATKQIVPPAPRHPAPPRHVAPIARPAAPPSRKPSPAQPAAPEPDAAEAAVTASTDCGKQLPALQKGAARGDVKARAGLGMAYYTGRCVSRDLPTAYHWYALALHAEPDNSQVSAQLEAIWKQMSPAERQLALKAQ